ncbi:hypothetical protein D9M68_661310 [compost metagenome]
MLPRGELLRAGHQIALDHDPEDGAAAAANLLRHVPRHIQLPLMLLAAVGMAEIHHQRVAQPCRLQLPAGRRHGIRIVVGDLAAAQDDVAIRIALGVHRRDLAVLVHAQEVVRTRCGLDRVDRNPDISVGAILEADRR